MQFRIQINVNFFSTAITRLSNSENPLRELHSSSPCSLGVMYHTLHRMAHLQQQTQEAEAAAADAVLASTCSLISLLGEGLLQTCDKSNTRATMTLRDDKPLVVQITVLMLIFSYTTH